MELKAAPKGHTIRNNSNKIFNLLKKNSKGKYPPTYDIPEEDQVYMEWTDRDGKEREGLRHIRYAIGEKSIFVDEQSDLAANKRGIIRFIDGMLVVNEMEKTKLYYLEVCNYNKTNHEAGTALNTKTPLFRGDAAKHEAKIKLQKTELKRKLYNIVAEYSVQELEGLSLAMGVAFPDESLGEEKYEAGVMEVRARFNAMIDYDPNRFEKEVQSDITRHKTVLGYALRDKIISYDPLDRVFYNEIGGKTKILEVPSYADKIDFFVDMALKRTEYQDVYQDIKKLVEKGKNRIDGSFKRTNAFKLIQKAIELKVADNKYGTIVVNNVGALGEESSGVQGATVYLQENKDKYKAVEELVKKAEADKK
jgi:hypothetical protein